MEFSKLTTKHQATIPKPIRKKLALQAGYYIQFHEQNGQVVVTKLKRVDSDYLGTVGITEAFGLSSSKNKILAS